MLTTLPQNKLLDLQPWVGQRSATFIFELIDGVSGLHRGFINPIRNANLSHDTGRTIKRQLTLGLGVTDTKTVNPITDRIKLTMKLGDGSTWPLGRYIFTDDTQQFFTSGSLSNVVLNDEMFIVDQEIVEGFDASGLSVPSAYGALLADFGFTLNMEPSGGFTSVQSWSQGTHRASILGALAVAGDYFSPWFGNDAALHLIRTFNPADEVPQFDWDAGNQVVRAGITNSSNILVAPNRFVVISNVNAGIGGVTGVATVPPSAPNSFEKRGFYITQTQTLQLNDASQAAAVATGLANRGTVFETVDLETAPDPRHDSYDVIKWQDELWLELAWTMNLQEGGRMRHTLRKGYTSS